MIEARGVFARPAWLLREHLAATAAMQRWVNAPDINGARASIHLFRWGIDKTVNHAFVFYPRALTVNEWGHAAGSIEIGFEQPWDEQTNPEETAFEFLNNVGEIVSDLIEAAKLGLVIRGIDLTREPSIPVHEDPYINCGMVVHTGLRG